VLSQVRGGFLLVGDTGLEPVASRSWPSALAGPSGQDRIDRCLKCVGQVLGGTVLSNDLPLMAAHIPEPERIARALCAVADRRCPQVVAAVAVNVAVSSVVVMGGGKPIVRELPALDTGGLLDPAAFNPGCHGR